MIRNNNTIRNKDSVIFIASMLKLLTVVADDFGYCCDRNRAIEECFLYHNGAIETSLLVNSNYAQHAISISQKTGLSTGELITS